uniref:Uncharacterized protein n=1 Tax=Sus scrofa TaxID=9823 RepID=A0A4X1U2X3_PIG
SVSALAVPTGGPGQGEGCRAHHPESWSHVHPCPILTGIEDGLQRLDVCGHPRYPVDADLLDAPLLHLLHTLPDDVGHLGALPPGGEGTSGTGGGREAPQ